MPHLTTLRRPLVALLAAGVSVLPTGCATAGAEALSEGRSLYNEVITRTADEQVLSMIVRHRYDETFGMLEVASVTSQLQFEANSAINLGFSDQDNYEGNLVPFAAGISYSESPTISYVPMSGEQFMRRLVAPLSLAQTLTLAQMSRIRGQAFDLMVNRINGLSNTAGIEGTPTSFQRASQLLAETAALGIGDIVMSGDDYVLSLHDYQGEHEGLVKELLDLLHLSAFKADGVELQIPIRPGLGRPPLGDAILLETRSVLDLVRLAGDTIDVPQEHLAAGYVSPSGPGDPNFIRFHSARERPAESSVAVQHRGWWFYIDGTDIPSKRGFVLLRAVISMGIEHQPDERVAPVLSLDVGG